MDVFSEQIESFKVLLISTAFMAAIGLFGLLHYFLFAPSLPLWIGVLHAIAAGTAFPNAAILTVKDSGSSSATAFAIFGMAKMGLATFIAFLATHFVDAPAEYFLGSIVVCSGLAFVVAIGYNSRSLMLEAGAQKSPIKTEPKS